MTISTDNPELTSLRAKCASLESLLKTERSAHACTKEALKNNTAQTENDTMLRFVLNRPGFAGGCFV